jgi:hypothetical protein
MTFIQIAALGILFWGVSRLLETTIVIEAWRGMWKFYFVAIDKITNKKL